MILESFRSPGITTSNGIIQILSLPYILCVEISHNPEKLFHKDWCFRFPQTIHCFGLTYKLVARILATHHDGRHFYCMVKSNFPTQGVYVYNDLVNGGIACLSSSDESFGGFKEHSYWIFYVRESEEEIYCTCRRPFDAEMVGCDNPVCPIAWYHLKCLSSPNITSGKWFCPMCVETV